MRLLAASVSSSQAVACARSDAAGIPGSTGIGHTIGYCEILRRSRFDGALSNFISGFSRHARAPPIAALQPAPFFGSTRGPMAAKSNRTSLLVMVAGTIETAAGCSARSAVRNCHPKYAKLSSTKTAANATASIMTLYVMTPFPCEARSQGESALGPRLLPSSSTTTQCYCARRMALTEASACWQTAMSPARLAARARSRKSSATSKSRPREPSVAASAKGVG